MEVHEIANEVEGVIGYYMDGHVEPEEFVRALGDRSIGPFDPKDIKQTYITPIEDREDSDMALSGEGEPVTVLLRA